MNLKAMNKKQLLIIIGNMKKDELIEIIQTQIGGGSYKSNNLQNSNNPMNLQNPTNSQNLQNSKNSNNSKALRIGI